MKGNQVLTFSISKKFAAGILTFWAVQSLQMDCLGMDGTIRHIANNWVSPWVTVPLAIVVLVIAAFLCNDPKPQA